MTGKRAVETGGQGEPLQGSLSWVQGRGGGGSVPGTQGGHDPVSVQVFGQLQPSIRLGRPHTITSVGCLTWAPLGALIQRRKDAWRGGQSTLRLPSSPLLPPLLPGTPWPLSPGSEPQEIK